MANNDEWDYDEYDNSFVEDNNNKRDYDENMIQIMIWKNI
jgi:hypothetical protein